MSSLVVVMNLLNGIEGGDGKAICSLLPLNCAGRLRRHVIDDAVDAPDFIDDAIGYPAEESHLKGVEICRHTIG